LPKAKSDVRFEPSLQTYCNAADVRYQVRTKKPSTTAWVLNGVFGNINFGDLEGVQKRAFMKDLKERPPKKPS